MSSPVFPCLLFINMYKCMDRFTNEHLSTTIETLGLPRLSRSLLTLIGSCRIYSVFQIKAGRFRTRYRSSDRFAKETICSSSLALTKNSVINKTQTQNGAQTLYFNLLQTVQQYKDPGNKKFCNIHSRSSLHLVEWAVFRTIDWVRIFPYRSLVLSIPTNQILLCL